MPFDPTLYPNITVSKNLIRTANTLEQEFHTGKRGAFNPSKTTENFAIAFLMGPLVFEINPGATPVDSYYFAHHSINTINDLGAFLINGTKGFEDGTKVCLKNENPNFPVVRVGRNLKVTTPTHFTGYAERKKGCCERKIIERLSKEIENCNFGDPEEAKAHLFVYTKLEPCIYCYMAMETLNEKYKNIPIHLYYHEQIYDMILQRDELLEDDDFRRMLCRL